MLRILGSPTKLCDGLTRRDLLHVGGFGAFGLTLPSFLKLKASETVAQPPSHDGAFGKAKACILLFPYGSPPQHETFDPKPDAPAEIQGETEGDRDVRARRAHRANGCRASPGSWTASPSSAR